MINFLITKFINLKQKLFSGGEKRKASLKKGFISGLLIGVLSALLFYINAYEKLESITIDTRFLLRQNPVLTDKLVFIGLSKDCIEQLGKYPIPRGYYARLVDIVSQAGAKSIFFDIFFDLPTTKSNDDERLAKSIKTAGNITLPVFTPNKLDMYNNQDEYFVTPSIRKNIPVLSAVAQRFGHINIIPGSDGKIRHIPAVLLNNNRYVFPMALEGYLQYMGIKHEDVVVGHNYIKAGNLIVPTKNNCIQVNYFNPAKAIEFSHVGLIGNGFSSGIQFLYFKDVLSGKIDPGFLKGKLVLIGQTCHGLTNSDEYITPFDIMFGAFIQASLINSFLTGKFLYQLEPEQTIILIILFSIFIGVLFSNIRFNYTILNCLLLSAALITVSIVLFSKGGFILEIIPFLVCIYTNFIVHLIKSIKDAFKLVSEKDVELGIISKSSEKILDIYDISNTPRIIISNTAEALSVEAALLYLQRKKNENISNMTLEAEYYKTNYEYSIKKEIYEIIDYLTYQIHKTQKPVLINDFDKSPENKSGHTKIRSLLLVPLMIHGELIGLIFLCNKLNPKTKKIVNFANNDLLLLKSMLAQSAVALENFQLYNNMHNLFMSTIKSLVSSIDAKDEYTAGHSERVTAVAVLIGEEMGLDQKTMENLRISAILHDIGKIGISESILCSKARLTDEEFMIIKSHPSKGEEILRHIMEFQEIIPGVKHHHEKYDGTGYPDRLAGENIPLISRIIAVADTFDAITSDRTYRNKNTTEFAITEIQRCAGTQFDPNVVEAFKNCLDKYNTLLMSYEIMKDSPDNMFWDIAEEMILRKEQTQTPKLT